MEKVYLDYAATTYLDKRVLKEMSGYFTETFGNANSQHWFGREAEKAVVAARVKIAGLINCKPNEIYFTSGGTEADNWAVRGAAGAYGDSGRHIITTSVEHHAIYDTCRAMEKKGYEVTYLPVKSDGIVDLEALKKALRSDTVLVSIMYANNEIGTVMPLGEAVKITGEFAKANKRRIIFHTDCVQAAGALELDVQKLGVDLMSVSAHKFYGPKGIGFLYVKNGVRLEKLMTGGFQERKMRGGTTNVPLVVGMAKALELAVSEREKNNARLKKLRDYFVKRVTGEIDRVYVNGSMEQRLPSNANLSFEFIEGESILFSLDLNGIAASSGSACSSGSLDPSHVLLALGLRIELAHGSIRFSLGKSTTKRQIDYTVECLKQTVERLRNMSPLFYQAPSVKTEV